MKYILKRKEKEWVDKVKITEININLKKRTWETIRYEENHKIYFRKYP